MRRLAVHIVLAYLRFFARIALFVHRPKIIGIAGSVGKTSTKYALKAILEKKGKTVITSGNSETGVPLGILGIALGGYSPLHWLIAILRCPFGVFNLIGVSYLIVEMGIDDPCPPKNMEHLLTIVDPDVAVFVTESAAHTMQFEKALTVEEVQGMGPTERRDLLIRRITAEDAKMITDKTDIVVYNADNAFIMDELKKLRRSNKTMLSFGSAPDNRLSYGRREVTLGATFFEFKLGADYIAFRVNDYALPAEYREVFGGAILAAYAVGETPTRIQQALSSFRALPKGRVSLLRGINDSVIIDSSYNASRASMMAFLGLAQELRDATQRPIVFVFGDMRELGGEAELEHADVARRAVEVAEYLYCVGPLTKQYVMPIAEQAGLQELQWFENARLLGSYLRAHLPHNAIVLVKGSQNQIFLEEAIKFILASEKDVSRLCRQERYWKKE
ncbi:MAG: Mur ligase family protein [Patescibacteria group bacterium]